MKMCFVIINQYMFSYKFLLSEKIRGEEGEKKESVPSAKRPSSGCGEMENTILTKRPRTHQQNENQQVNSWHTFSFYSHLNMPKWIWNVSLDITNAGLDYNPSCFFI